MNNSRPTNRRPSAVMVSRNLPPLTGGMERLNHHAYQALGKRFKVALCGPAGANSIVREEDTCREVGLSSLSRFLVTCQWKTFRLARRFRPAIVYSGSGLTAPAALLAGRSTRAPVACFLHGLDIVADHPAYRLVFLPAIRRCDRLIVNSRHTAGLAIAAGVPEERIVVVHPGVDLPNFSLREGARARFRDQFGFGSRPFLLAAGRLTERKGLAPFIRHALPEVVRHLPETLLVIIGEEPSHGLKHRQGIITEIQTAIREAKMQSHVVLLGAVDDEQLSDAYFSADVHVFPVLERPGDVEGFGMVAIEAAAHGLPTVAFKAGGVGDAVAHGQSGWLVEPGQYDELTHNILNALDRANSHTEQSHVRDARAHAERFCWNTFDSRFLDAIEPLLQRSACPS